MFNKDDVCVCGFTGGQVLKTICWTSSVASQIFNSSVECFPQSSETEAKARLITYWFVWAKRRKTNTIFFFRLAFIHKETDVEIKIPMAWMTERFFFFCHVSQFYQSQFRFNRFLWTSVSFTPSILTGISVLKKFLQFGKFERYLKNGFETKTLRTKCMQSKQLSRK